MVAIPTAPGIVVGVVVDRREKLGLERDCGVGACQNLQDKDESIVKASYVAEQIPYGVSSALLYYNFVC